MVKITMKGFKSVELKYGGVSIIRGGHFNKPVPLLSKDVRSDGSEQFGPAATYVHIKPKEPWLIQAVLGNSSRGEMYPGVLAESRERVVTM